MSHYITEACIATKDTACVDVCPVDCIHPRHDEADFATEPMLYIDPGVCIDCGLCVDECPVRAIYLENHLPPDQRHVVQLNIAYYERKAAQGDAAQPPSPGSA